MVHNNLHIHFSVTPIKVSINLLHVKCAETVKTREDKASIMQDPIHKQHPPLERDPTVEKSQLTLRFLIVFTVYRAHTYNRHSVIKHGPEANPSIRRAEETIQLHVVLRNKSQFRHSPEQVRTFSP